MKGYVFVKNAIVLTMTALLLRTIGIVFRIWLAGKIGSEGIGLYQLIFSVYIFAATFSLSGISTAVTRLVSEEQHKGKNSVKKIMRRCVFITLFIATLSTVVIFFGADFICTRLLNDVRAVLSVKILSFSLPFMGLSACFRGFFISRRKTVPQSLTQIFEQIVRIVVVVLLVGFFSKKGLAYSAAAVLIGDLAAEAFSCCLLYFLYQKEKKNLCKTSKLCFKVFRRILKIALPITASKYVTSGLHTLETLIVPIKLSVFNNSKEKSLSQFGMLKGMAMPILFFPASFLTSLSTLLIPEISEACAKNELLKVSSAVSKALKTTLSFSFLIGSVFIVSGPHLGVLIYNSKEVGYIIRMLAPIVPFMYAESVADGILKGLDQQTKSFFYSIADSALRIGLIFCIVPNHGLSGFLVVMIISNCLTSILNCRRLLIVSNTPLDIKNWILIPLFCSFIGSVFGKTTSYMLADSVLLFLAVEITIHCGIFFFLMFLFGGFKQEVSIIKAKKGLLP